MRLKKTFFTTLIVSLIILAMTSGYFQPTAFASNEVNSNPETATSANSPNASTSNGAAAPNSNTANDDVTDPSWYSGEKDFEAIKKKWPGYNYVITKPGNTNPFEEFYSTDEIKAEQASGNGKVIPHGAKFYFTPNGGEKKLIEGAGIWRLPDVDGTIDVYSWVGGYDNLTDGVHSAGASYQPYKVSADKQRIEAVGADVNIPLDLVEINGQKIDPNNYQGSVFDNMKEVQYIHYQYKLKANVLKVSSGDYLLSSRMVARNSAGRLVASAPNSRINRSGYHTTSVNFHPVNDFEYRKLLNIKATDKIPARNSGKEIFSSSAHKVLSLTDVIDKESNKDYFWHYNLICDMETALRLASRGNVNSAHSAIFPILSLDNKDEVYDSAAKDFKDKSVFTDKAWYYALYYTALGPGTGEAPSFKQRYDATLERPTLKQLLDYNIPGYVQTGHDLDLPKSGDLAQSGAPKSASASTGPSGNWYATLGVDENENLLKDKHYYITYRPIPVPVKITKQDKDGKNLEGAVFKLYKKLEDGTEVTIADNLKSDAKGEILLGKSTKLSDLKSIAKDDSKVSLEKSVYIDGTDIYLIPGEYYLKEVEAPKGYSLNKEDKKLNVTFNTKDDDVKTIECVIVDDKIPANPVDNGTDKIPTKPGKVEGKGNPETGDVSGYGLFYIIGVASLIALSSIIRRKQTNK